MKGQSIMHGTETIGSIGNKTHNDKKKTKKHNTEKQISHLATRTPTKNCGELMFTEGLSVLKLW